MDASQKYAAAERLINGLRYQVCYLRILSCTPSEPFVILSPQAAARVKQDVYAVLHQVPFLTPVEGQLSEYLTKSWLPVNRNIACACRSAAKPGAPPTKLLCLDGTIQTYYQGVAYQTPVCSKCRV